MISATQIATWANTSPAKAALPRLIRRLVHAVAKTSQVSIPAGESTVLPGFDGESYCEVGNAWVPSGHSCWEMSCQAAAGSKANEDFNKRTAETLPDRRKNITYVAVTARRWPGKGRWRNDKIAANLWKDVRIYDADDLEQWLEQVPAIALAFGEELGLIGPGVESLATYIEKWGGQCSPVITPEALLTGRNEQVRKLVERINHRLSGKLAAPLAVKADSVQEAVAFIAAGVQGDESLASSAVVVTSLEGWRFIETNTGILTAVAATPAIAEAPTSRLGLAVVVPYASGDMARQFKGAAGRLNDSELRLERPGYSEFEAALQSMGMARSDAVRLSSMCGRSWSVFRRQHATNPAIRRPVWLNHPGSGALATVCLVGTWTSERQADKDILSRIASRPYTELEADLVELERLDDSPILRIGSVWKAKSALELFAIFGERINEDILTRYFQIVEEILSTDDPLLELKKEERYAAAVYGKTRPVSGLLLDALCDTLTKLAVRGPEISSLLIGGITSRIDQLIRNLLRGTDRARWLSLASHLPALAEASPNEFLAAIEESMIDPAGSVYSLFQETDGSGLGSRCWHAGILWALEILAWAPNRLKRISLILAKLRDIPIKGNWGNNPQETLLSLYRPWLPQTAATIEQRINALDFLIESTPDPAYELLDKLTGAGPDYASPAARPQWRDDDAGAGYGATGAERYQMTIAAIDRQIEMSKESPYRTAKLIRKYFFLDEERQKIIIKFLGNYQNISDTEKEEIRKELRHQLYWHRNFDKEHEEETIDALLAPLDMAYAALEPRDLTVRYAWLFSGDWIELPVRMHDDEFGARQGKVADAACAALSEIFDSHGWAGVLALAAYRGTPWVVGMHLGRIGLAQEELGRWIAEESGELLPGEMRTHLAGAILSSLPPDERMVAVDEICTIAGKLGHGTEWMTRLLIICPHETAIWRYAEKIGQIDLFWSNCSGNLWLSDPIDIEFALRNLIVRQRPISAFNACHGRFTPYSPEIVMEMLDGIRQGHELSAQNLPETYALQRAVDYLEGSGQIDEMRLAQLEFALIGALGFGGQQHAKSLYHALMTRPELFVELLCLVYKPRHAPPHEGDAPNEAAIRSAWDVLHYCRWLPGMLRDGSVDPEAHAQFIRDVRRRAAELDRLEICDTTLGEIMAHASADTDGVWPSEPIRNTLEHMGSEEMLNGFRIGCLNKRGTQVRGPFEGGDQERDLARSYREQALMLEPTHERLSAILIDLAQYYDRDGIIEDQTAQLRQEGR